MMPRQQNDQRTKRPPNQGDGALRTYLRDQIRESLPARTELDDYELSLSADADLLLQQTAAYIRSNISRVISIILNSCADLLTIAKSDGFRPWAAGGHAEIKDPSASQSEGANLAKARSLYDDILARKHDKSKNASVRRHLVIARAGRQLLGEVAEHLSVSMNDIIESLVMLGLESPEESKHSVATEASPVT
jgi:hypothetical protein